MRIIAIYESPKGKHPFKIWLYSLRDRVVIARIHARLSRIEFNHFGDTKSVGFGVMEMRLDFGSGYRIYYACYDEKLVVLLNGGDKSSQRKDINDTHKYWADYLLRNHNEKNK